MNSFKILHCRKQKIGAILLANGTSSGSWPSGMADWRQTSDSGVGLGIEHSLSFSAVRSVLDYFNWYKQTTHPN
jgi:hypothetical protein